MQKKGVHNPTPIRALFQPNIRSRKLIDNSENYVTKVGTHHF